MIRVGIVLLLEFVSWWLDVLNINYVIGIRVASRTVSWAIVTEPLAFTLAFTFAAAYFLKGARDFALALLITGLLISIPLGHELVTQL